MGQSYSKNIKVKSCIICNIDYIGCDNNTNYCKKCGTKLIIRGDI